MTAAARDHLRQAVKLADALVDQLDAAVTAGLEPYAVEAGRFAAAEARVVRRRVSNLAKVLGAMGKGPDDRAG